MPDKLKSIKKVFSRRLSILNNMEDVLDSELRKASDNTWGVEVVKKIGVHFDRLKALDCDTENFALSTGFNDYDREIADLAEKLRDSMKNVCKLLSIFQIKIKGGKELVRKDLKKAAKARKIAGYKAMII